MGCRRESSWPFQVARRKLQNLCALADDQTCDKHHAPIGKFQRVMVQIGPVHVDLSKAGQTLIDVAAKQSAVQPCAVIKNDLCPGTKADGGARIERRCKATSVGSREPGDYDGLACLGRP